jgi:hypothetical protein
MKVKLSLTLIEELGVPHFEGSKWVRRTPHRTRNVKRWDFQKQSAVRLKIAKVWGAMSKVRRTQFFNECSMRKSCN